MGPTPTRTLGIRLLCNFVNGYTMAYRVQYTFTRVHARIPNGHPREEKRACRTSRRGSLCMSGWWQAKHAGHADPRAEVGEDVCVGAVPWNLSLNESINEL